MRDYRRCEVIKVDENTGLMYFKSPSGVQSAYIPPFIETLVSQEENLRYAQTIKDQLVAKLGGEKGLTKLLKKLKKKVSERIVK